MNGSGWTKLASRCIVWTWVHLLTYLYMPLDLFTHENDYDHVLYLTNGGWKPLHSTDAHPNALRFMILFWVVYIYFGHGTGGSPKVTAGRSKTWWWGWSVLPPVGIMLVCQSSRVPESSLSIVCIVGINPSKSWVLYDIAITTWERAVLKRLKDRHPGAKNMHRPPCDEIKIQHWLALRLFWVNLRGL